MRRGLVSKKRRNCKEGDEHISTGMGDEGKGVPATCPLFHPERLKQSPQVRVRGGKEAPGACRRLGGVFEQSGG